MKNKAIDIEEFIKIIGNDAELAKTILIEFMANIKEMWSELQDTLESEDYNHAKHLFHTMGGGCVTVFATELGKLLYLGEKAISKDMTNYDAIKLITSKVESILPQLYEELETFLQ